MYKKQIIMIVVLAVFTVLLGFAAVQAATPGFQGYYGYSTFGDFDTSWGYVPGSCTVCTYACNRAEFVKDVTVPDDSYIASGTFFTKTWRIRNIGSTTWTTSYRLVYTSGTSMSHSMSVSLPYSVAPGYWVDISVPMQAPNATGTYQGNWMLQSPDGSLFGVGCNGQIPVWAKISTVKNNCACVAAYSCNCVMPCYGSTCTITNYQKSQKPAQPARNPYCNNKIRSISDITFPDGTEVAPNTYFRKTWRMKNGGTCVWNEGYTMIFTGGDGMSGASAVKMPKKVYPGEYVELSIDLRAPTIPGIYRGNFMLRDDLGYTFGYGSYANTAFWVEVKVSEAALVEETIEATASEPVQVITETPAPTATPTADVAATIVPALPVTTSTPTPTTDPSLLENDDPLYEEDDNGDGFYTDVLEPGEGVKALNYNECGTQHIEIEFMEPNIYSIKWFVTNNGTAVWNPDTYRVINTGLSDKLVMIGTDITVPVTNPGEEAVVSMAVKLVNAANTSDLWMKYHLSDGNETFCEVYFPINPL